MVTGDDGAAWIPAFAGMTKVAGNDKVGGNDKRVQGMTEW